MTVSIEQLCIATVNAREVSVSERRGRIIVNTGDGKGKTTAALGTAFRALGHGQKVCMIQFLKGKGEYGERIFAKNIPLLEWHVCGRGFVFRKEDISADREVAEQGFALAEEKIKSDRFDLVILDEITYLPLYGFLEIEKIINLLRNKPEKLSIILTGRSAHDKLIDIADTVSRMEVVKHAYSEGVKAQKGIEF